MQVRAIAEAPARCVEVASEHLAQRVRRMEARDLARPVQFAADVLEPEYLAIRGVQKRDPVSAEVEGTAINTLGVPLRLGENVLGPECHLLRLHDTQQLPVDNEGVISRSI